TFARRERAPRNRLPIRVRDEPGRRPVLHDLLESFLIARSLLLLEIRPRQAPPHAPAAAARAALAEEFLNIGPAIRRERKNLEVFVPAHERAGSLRRTTMTVRSSALGAPA